MTRILMLIALAGCEDGAFPVDAECPEGGRHIGGTVLPQDLAPVQATDLRVIGQARHKEGLAIRTVEALGVIADNTGFNHDAWEMTLPVSSLVNEARTLPLPAGADPAEAVVPLTVEVEATDACGRREVIGSFVVDVDLSPSSRLDRLSLTPQLPVIDGSAIDHLPADGSAEVTLLVTANPSAVGSTVTLEAAAGTFRGVDADRQVQLTGDGIADATATVFYAYGGDPYDGDVLLTASGSGAVGTTVVAIAGPPRFTPAALTLGPGDAQTVTVLTDGQLDLCFASGAQVGDLQVVAGTTSLLDGPVPADWLQGDPYPGFDVSFPADAADGGEVSVTCEDVYGQLGTGTFTGTL